MLEDSTGMPTGEETGLTDGMLSRCACYAQQVEGTKGFGGGYTTVYMVCETHTRHPFEIRKLDWSILYWFMHEVQFEHT